MSGAPLASRNRWLISLIVLALAALASLKLGVGREFILKHTQGAPLVLGGVNVALPSPFVAIRNGGVGSSVVLRWRSDWGFGLGLNKLWFLEANENTRRTFGELEAWCSRHSSSCSASIESLGNVTGRCLRIKATHEAKEFLRWPVWSDSTPLFIRCAGDPWFVDALMLVHPDSAAAFLRLLEGLPIPSAEAIGAPPDAS